MDDQPSDKSPYVVSVLSQSFSLLSFVPDHTVPYGTVLSRDAFPGTSCQATIGVVPPGRAGRHFATASSESLLRIVPEGRCDRSLARSAWNNQTKLALTSCHPRIETKTTDGLIRPYRTKVPYRQLRRIDTLPLGIRNLAAASVKRADDGIGHNQSHRTQPKIKQPVT